MGNRCCCGKVEFDDDLTPMVFNDMMHEVLGPAGNFCGPVYTHDMRNAAKEIAVLREALKLSATELVRINEANRYDSKFDSAEDCLDWVQSRARFTADKVLKALGC